MKLYLSSYKIGEETKFLKKFISEHGNKIAYIQNAVNFINPKLDKIKAQRDEDVQNLIDLGFEVTELDLRNYFGKKDALRLYLNEIDAVWVAGGNTFILRQAMYLSGFDELLIEELSERDNFLYAAYSAGCCVLSPSLEYLQTVDHPNEFPYEGSKETIWDGLGIIDFALLPHYDSDHPESADIDKEIKYCIDNKIIFLALRDGEVITEDGGSECH